MNNLWERDDPKLIENFGAVPLLFELNQSGYSECGTE